jgi:hypothetical protein
MESYRKSILGLITKKSKTKMMKQDTMLCLIVPWQTNELQTSKLQKNISYVDI